MAQQQLQYITPAHVAREAGISADTARAYLSELSPKDGPPRTQHRFDAARLPELVAFCQSKRRRRYFNRFNAQPREKDSQ